MENQPTYPVGNVKRNPLDSRNIDLAMVQAPVSGLPAKYKTDISMIAGKNQLALGTCVEQTEAFVRSYYWYKKTGLIVQFSARSLAIAVKQIDGDPQDQGTSPIYGAKAITTAGIAPDSVVIDDNTLPWNEYITTLTPDQQAEMKKYVLANYAFVTPDQISLQQAIFQNGLVTVTSAVDSNWFSGNIGAVTDPIGEHRTVLFGYDESGFYGRNSWGDAWEGKSSNPEVVLGPGEFYLPWSEYSNNIFDAQVYTEVPAGVLAQTQVLRVGSYGVAVVALQNALGIKADGIYGQMTKAAVITFQRANGLTPDGIAGPITQAALFAQKKSLV